MPPFVTLRKGGVPYDFLLYEYDEAKGGGRLNKSSTLEELELATLKLKYEGRARFVPVSFDTDGYSRERIMDGTTYDVSGRAAQPPAAQPGAMGMQAGGAATDVVKLFKKINKKLEFIQRETFRMSFAVPASSHSSVYRGAAIAAYEPAGKAAATAATLRCLITNKYYPADQVVAAHIYQLCWPQAIPAALNIDIDSDKNVVPMLKTVERAFDRMRLCILPDAPGIFKVKVLDKSLITNTAARDRQGVDWAQVDDSVLKFVTEAQPSAAMCAAHARRAVVEAEDQKWIEPGSLKVREPTWERMDAQLMGRYLHDSLTALPVSSSSSGKGQLVGEQGGGEEGGGESGGGSDGESRNSGSEGDDA
uniref:HNH nuclease domain-containing protein n=1 Tax=Chlamydomonas leiostraca TaxID=1034604 RepID=A0A7S0REG4_9CHLO|mmetsp:Transcript_20845/g.53015  ORF Transcript_20845/g.53015 Transcript_20845/m.53015 type:complete len:363 (+) Transcript_20845:284-1372(+)